MNRIFSRFPEETGNTNNPVEPAYFKIKNTPTGYMLQLL